MRLKKMNHSFHINIVVLLTIIVLLLGSNEEKSESINSNLKITNDISSFIYNENLIEADSVNTSTALSVNKEVNFDEAFLDIIQNGDYYLSELPDELRKNDIMKDNIIVRENYYLTPNNIEKFKNFISDDFEEDSYFTSTNPNVESNLFLQTFYKEDNENTFFSHVTLVSKNELTNLNVNTYVKKYISNIDTIVTKIERLEDLIFDDAVLIEFKFLTDRTRYYAFMGFEKLETPITFYNFKDKQNVNSDNLLDFEDEYIYKVYTLTYSYTNPNKFREVPNHLGSIHIFDKDKFISLIETINKKS